MTINVFTDGGARGNPGPAALGVYIVNENNDILYAYGKYIGFATNNVAEYSAILEAFNFLCLNKSKFAEAKISFYMDSLLAMSQLTGKFKVKNAKIREILFEIRKKEQELGIDVSYSHIPREKNKKADEMVNIALDKEILKT